MGAGMEGVVEPEGDFAGASVVMVDWEEEREKVLARGARCVSFNSGDVSASWRRSGSEPALWVRADQGGIGGGDDVLLVSFHDMAGGGRRRCMGWRGSVWATEGGVEGRRSSLI